MTNHTKGLFFKNTLLVIMYVMIPFIDAILTYGGVYFIFTRDNICDMTFYTKHVYSIISVLFLIYFLMIKAYISFLRKKDIK